MSLEKEHSRRHKSQVARWMLGSQAAITGYPAPFGTLTVPHTLAEVAQDKDVIACPAG
jgi:hypothetical protein